MMYIYVNMCVSFLVLMMIYAKIIPCSSEMLEVTGYDTSLPEDDLRSALSNYFSSCGEVMDVVLFPNKTWPETREYALISIHGEDAKEKAMQLSGIVVVKAPGYIPQALPRVRRIPYGHTYPGT